MLYFMNPLSSELNERHDYYLLNAWQGHWLERVGKLEEAIIHYEKLTAFVPDAVEPHQALVRLLYRMNLPEKAQAHELEVNTLLRLENIYRQALKADQDKNFEPASNYFGQIVAKRPAYKHALFYKGLMLQMLDRHEEAIGYYQQSLQYVPGYFQALFNLAYAFMKTGAYQQAIQHFEQTLEVKPDYYEVYAHLSWCYERLNQPAIAQELKEKYFRLTKTPSYK
jgi:tetratricopeptide (TPR) repeat protein